MTYISIPQPVLTQYLEQRRRLLFAAWLHRRGLLNESGVR